MVQSILLKGYWIWMINIYLVNEASLTNIKSYLNKWQIMTAVRDTTHDYHRIKFFIPQTKGNMTLDNTSLWV